MRRQYVWYGYSLLSVLQASKCVVDLQIQHYYAHSSFFPSNLYQRTTLTYDMDYHHELYVSPRSQDIFLQQDRVLVSSMQASIQDSMQDSMQDSKIDSKIDSEQASQQASKHTNNAMFDCLVLSSNVAEQSLHGAPLCHMQAL